MFFICKNNQRKHLFESNLIIIKNHFVKSKFSYSAYKKDKQFSGVERSDRFDQSNSDIFRPKNDVGLSF